MVETKPENQDIYSDPPDYCMNRSTIPQDIITVSGSGSKPDLVIINRKDRKLDLEEKGYNVS